MNRTPPAGLEGLVAFVAALAGGAPGDQFTDLRWRHPRGFMGQRFFSIARPDAAATAAFVLGRRTDVYIGACPRTRRDGSKDAIDAGWALWADLDDRAAVEALARFAPAPAIVVRSGSAPNRHAYWPLLAPLRPGALEQANRRLARALGACESAVTNAAAVLRAPGSANTKHDPPTHAALETFTGERFDPAEVLGALPAEEAPGAAAASRPAPRPVEDPLRDIDPAVYVAALTGGEAGRDGKVCCPFHSDRTPSLHVYAAPEDGWYCFGCRRGGSVYDLGSAVLGLSTRGREFVELRERLYKLLLPDRDPPHKRRRPAAAARQ